MPKLRAARANRVFCTDEKHIRKENTVLVNTSHDAGVFHKIADCARMAFHLCAIDDPRGRDAGRASTIAAACRIYKVYPPIRTFKARSGLGLWPVARGSARIRLRRLENTNMPEVSA